MPNRSVSQQFPYFADLLGNALESGFIYIGVSGLDPETDPVAIFSDADLTVPLANPVRTLAGYPAVFGAPTPIFTADDCSLTVRTLAGVLVYRSLSGNSSILEGAAEGGLSVDQFSDLAALTYSTAPVGSVVRIAEVGEYRVLALTVTQPDFDYTGAGGVKLDVIGQAGFYRPEAYGGGTGKSAATNTAAIQYILDNAPLGSTLELGEGTYPVTSQASAVFTVSRNISIRGVGGRTILRGDAVSSATSMFEINMTDNGGLLDVRNWSMENIRCFFNVGGQHGVHITGGFTLNTCSIRNCAFSGNNTNGGYAFYDSSGAVWQHSLFELNTCGSPIYMQCGDANVFRKNNVFANSNGPAFTFDCVPGVRNNTVEANTLVCRDGALHVVDGDEVRFINNQIEQFQSYGANQSTPSASVYLEGATRTVTNCVIENNNFGGGTNVEYGVYADNAQHSVITRNNFVAHNTSEVHLTANSKFNIWEFDNQVKTQVANPRTDPYFKAVIEDLSDGWNIQTPKAQNGQNGWLGNVIYKRKDGMLVFLNQTGFGTNTADTIVYTLPVGFRGINTIENILAVNSQGGAGSFKITNTNGNVQVLQPFVVSGALAGITIPPVYRTPIATTDY